MFIEKLLSSRYIAKGSLDPVSSSSILPSALTDLLIKKKKKNLNFFIYSIIICPYKMAEKYPVEKNREEMRQNEPSNCAFWNVGVICPEMPVY